MTLTTPPARSSSVSYVAPSVLTSRTIAALRLPLIIMVVFCHALGLPEDTTIHWGGLDAMDWYNILRVSLAHGFCRSAVPVFFIISGYLFFLKMQQSDWAFYKRQWTKRVRSLLIPYLIWNILLLVKTLSLDAVAMYRQGQSLGGVVGSLDVPSLFRIFWSGEPELLGQMNLFHQLVDLGSRPMHGALWFVRELMLAVLLAPLLCRLLRKSRGWLLLLVLGVLYVLSVQAPIPTLSNTFIYSQLFFCIGAWFALHRRGLAELAARHVAWTLPLWVVLVALSTRLGEQHTDTGLLFFPWMCLVGAAAIMGCMARWGRVERPSRGGLIAYAANNTFFIYLSHGLFGIGVSRLLLGLLYLPEPVIYLLTPFLTAVVCLSVLWVMKRYMPRVTAVMLGERT